MEKEAQNYQEDEPYPHNWLDWKWQFRNRITTVEDLSEVIHISDKEKQEIAACLTRFRMAITPYYASLMDPDNPDCPIRKQAVPSINETMVLPYEMADPLAEERDSPVKILCIDILTGYYSLLPACVPCIAGIAPEDEW